MSQESIEPAEPPVSVPPTPAGDRWAHRRGEPRTFAAAWIVYLFAAAIVALGAGGSLGLVATDAYRASARVLMVLVGVGITVLWPMLRLSQVQPERSIGASVRDFFVVLVPVQAVVWPQALPWMAAWPWEVVAALAAHFAAWGVIVSGTLARAAALTPGGRAAAMALLVMAALLAPGVRLAVGPVEDLARRAPPPDRLLTASPVTGAWELCRDRSWSGRSAEVSLEQWSIIAAEGAAGVLVWAAAVAKRRRQA